MNYIEKANYLEARAAFIRSALKFEEGQSGLFQIEPGTIQPFRTALDREVKASGKIRKFAVTKTKVLNQYEITRIL